MLTVYVLMWPLIVLGVLIAIAGGFAKDVKKARDEGRPVI
ncbi:putative transporter small subunit [Brachybacterium saurashtrense]|nr:putative transporter small subunit [Brachybacterium saurashtrense]